MSDGPTNYPTELTDVTVHKKVTLSIRCWVTYQRINRSGHQKQIMKFVEIALKTEFSCQPVVSMKFLGDEETVAKAIASVANQGKAKQASCHAYLPQPHQLNVDQQHFCCQGAEVVDDQLDYVIILIYQLLANGESMKDTLIYF